MPRFPQPCGVGVTWGGCRDLSQRPGSVPVPVGLWINFFTFLPAFPTRTDVIAVLDKSAHTELSVSNSVSSELQTVGEPQVYTFCLLWASQVV